MNKKEKKIILEAKNNTLFGQDSKPKLLPLSRAKSMNYSSLKQTGYGSLIL